jgi:glc operon protein GlcG
MLLQLRASLTWLTMAGIALAAFPTSGQAQYLESKVISLEAAKKVAAAAEAEAMKRNWTVAIAVVDLSGGLILFHRIDDVQSGSLDVAIAKARTSARFKRPTRALADAVKQGNVGIVALPGVMPLPGGLPVTVDGKVIGAVGVSGMSADQDEIIAQAGLDGLPH